MRSMARDKHLVEGEAVIDGFTLELDGNPEHVTRIFNAMADEYAKIVREAQRDVTMLGSTLLGEHRTIQGRVNVKGTVTTRQQVGV